MDNYPCGIEIVNKIFATINVGAGFARPDTFTCMYAEGVETIQSSFGRRLYMFPLQSNPKTKGG